MIKLTEKERDFLGLVVDMANGDDYELLTGLNMPEIREMLTLPQVKMIRGCLPVLVRKGVVWTEKSPDYHLIGLTESGLGLVKELGLCSV